MHRARERVLPLLGLGVERSDARLEQDRHPGQYATIMYPQWHTSDDRSRSYMHQLLLARIACRLRRRRCSSSLAGRIASRPRIPYDFRRSLSNRLLPFLRPHGLVNDEFGGADQESDGGQSTYPGEWLVSDSNVRRTSHSHRCSCVSESSSEAAAREAVHDRIHGCARAVIVTEQP